MCRKRQKTIVFMVFSAMRSTLGVPCGRCFHIFGFSVVFTTDFSISDRIHNRFWSLRGSLRGPGGPWGVPGGS